MVAVVALSLAHSLGKTVAQDEAQTSSCPSLQESADGIDRTISNMPFGSVAGSELIGSVASTRLQRRWLVKPIGSNELETMPAVYPRFPKLDVWNDLVAPWRDQPTYLASRGFQCVPPKWRVHQGRLVFYWGRGFRSTEWGAPCNGFFVIPFQNDAIDYRCIEHGYDMKTDRGILNESSAGARRIENGKLCVERTVFKYKQNRRVLGFQGQARQLLDHLYPEESAGCDFVLSERDTGLFFTCPLRRHWERSAGLLADFDPYQENLGHSPCPMGEDLPSIMIVSQFEIQDRADVVIQRNNSHPDSAHTPAKHPVYGFTSEASKRQPETPDGVATMRWTEREWFRVPFAVPFTAAVDADDYFFVTCGGAVWHAPPVAGDGRRVCQRAFFDPSDPIIACIHESSTNRIFAFRRDSYIPVDNEHFPDDGPPRFVSCDDITHSKPLSFIDENGERRSADARFRLVSEAAQVLREDAMCR